MASARGAINRVLGAFGNTLKVNTAIYGAGATGAVKGVWNGLTRGATKALDLEGLAEIPLHKSKFFANTIGREWKPGVGFAIVGAGLMAGGGVGAFQAENSQDLGQIVGRQALAGSIHDTPSPGIENASIKPKWYDNDADGSLVLALHDLRRG